MDVAPDHVTVPVACGTYAAPLAEILGVNFVKWLLGRSGSYKSTLAALSQAHWGSSWDYHHLPGSWAATATYIEAQLHRAKDALLTIDNFVPPQSKYEAQALKRLALSGSGSLPPPPPRTTRMPRSRRRRSRRHRHVVRLDGDGVHRHRAKAIVDIQENIEGLVAVARLLDEIACETWAGAEPPELRQATMMMRAALAAINESVVDVAIGLGELRTLAGLSGITLDGPELVDDADEEEELG